MNRFNEEHHQKIRSYVYALIDPRDNRIFYIGKGTGNRIFQHEKDALADKDTVNPEKNTLIREIHKEGKVVIKLIIRWNLSNDEAFLLESVLIDLLSHPLFEGRIQMLNVIDGHDSAFNVQTPEEIESLFSTGNIDISNLDDKIIAITVTESIKGDALYERVRGNWNLSKERAEKAELVFAVYDGKVIGVFKPYTSKYMPPDESKEHLKRNWLQFTGQEITDPEILEKYLGKKLPSKSKGNANPIQYLF